MASTEAPTASDTEAQSLTDQFFSLVSLTVSRVQNNVGSSFSNMSTQKWLRLVIVLGAYMLLRPYLIKLGAKMSFSSLEKEQDAAKKKAEMTPNELRGHKVVIPDDSDDDGEGAGGATASGPDWGKKARRRQRETMKKLLEVEERRLKEQFEDEEDKDIQQYMRG